MSMETLRCANCSKQVVNTISEAQKDAVEEAVEKCEEGYIICGWCGAILHWSRANNSVRTITGEDERKMKLVPGLWESISFMAKQIKELPPKVREAAMTEYNLGVGIGVSQVPGDFSDEDQEEINDLPSTEDGLPNLDDLPMRPE